jgi:hypothetical protein
MKRPTRTQIAVVACLGVISAGTVVTIASTTAPEQTESKANGVIYSRYYDAVDTHAAEFADQYGRFASADIAFCVNNYGVSDEQLLRYAYQDYYSASPESIRRVYAVVHAYGVCSTF